LKSYWKDRHTANNRTKENIKGKERDTTQSKILEEMFAAVTKYAIFEQAKLERTSTAEFKIIKYCVGERDREQEKTG